MTTRVPAQPCSEVSQSVSPPWWSGRFNPVRRIRSGREFVRCGLSIGSAVQQRCNLPLGESIAARPFTDPSPTLHRPCTDTVIAHDTPTVHTYLYMSSESHHQALAHPRTHRAQCSSATLTQDPMPGVLVSSLLSLRVATYSGWIAVRWLCCLIGELIT